VEGFAPFVGLSEADFEYEDRLGLLTEKWYGSAIKEAWIGQWPKYYIEVKSSSGAARAPFHMSCSQVEKVSIQGTRRHIPLNPKSGRL